MKQSEAFTLSGYLDNRMDGFRISGRPGTGQKEACIF